MLARMIAASALSLALVTGAAAQAAGEAQVSPRSPIELFGETLVFFLPDWLEGSDVAALMAGSKVERQQTETMFRIEMIPADQEFSDWRDIQAILAQRGDVNVADELNTIEQLYREGCAAERTLVVRSDRMDDPPSDGSGFATVFCGAYAADPTKGEIGVFRVVRQGDVTARVYREWKGPAFELTDRAGFPVPLETLQGINAQMLATGFVRN